MDFFQSRLKRAAPNVIPAEERAALSREKKSTRSLIGKPRFPLLQIRQRSRRKRNHAIRPLSFASLRCIDVASVDELFDVNFFRPMFPSRIARISPTTPFYDSRVVQGTWKIGT
jgi:hypothetical protein